MNKDGNRKTLPKHLESPRAKSGQWFKKVKAQGTEALLHHPAPGPTPKLNAQQLAQLSVELSKGAEAFGFRGQVWTTERVAQMIQRVFGVRYHPAHCSRLLRTIKWSQQKPIQKATQRDTVAIETWKDEHWNALKKKPKTKIVPLSL